MEAFIPILVLNFKTQDQLGGLLTNYEVLSGVHSSEKCTPITWTGNLWKCYWWCSLNKSVCIIFLKTWSWTLKPVTEADNQNKHQTQYSMASQQVFFSKTWRLLCVLAFGTHPHGIFRSLKTHLLHVSVVWECENLLIGLSSNIIIIF